MNVNITKKTGATMPTGGKYCPEDITAVPVLQSVSATPTEAQQTFEPSNGFCGIGQIVVAPIPSDYVKPQGTLSITENGTQDVTNYQNVTVAVPAIVDVATAAEMEAKLVAANVGKAYRFTGTTDSTYTNGDIYVVEA